MSEPQSQEQSTTDDRPKGRRFDGRHLRSERTRQLMIEAYLQLVREHGRLPTANEIAHAAGYSVRSIFERFPDLDALSLAAADFAIAAGQAQAPAQNVDGDRPTRIASHVRIRAQACEKWLPLWRILTSPATQTQLAALAIRAKAVRRANVERLELMYRRELATLGPLQREQLMVTLAMLTSFESWDQMRSGGFGLSPEAAEGVWRSAIDRLLPSE
jgi:AcrR family transcriptional regulator